MDQMLTSHYFVWMWIAAGVSLIFLEIIMGFPIVFFIAGLAALTAALSIYVWINLNNMFIYQVIVFLAAVPAWMGILWYPLKRALHKHKNTNNYSNIIGQTATVYENELLSGKLGQIWWSGTIVKALLESSDPSEKIPSGGEVYIVEVKENIFIVKSKK